MGDGNGKRLRLLQTYGGQHTPQVLRCIARPHPACRLLQYPIAFQKHQACADQLLGRGQGSGSRRRIGSFSAGKIDIK